MALGALVEQVMDLYGILRLLKSRAVGPKVLRAALDDCAAGAAREAGNLASLGRGLAPPLVDVGRQVTAALSHALLEVRACCVRASATKLFAKSRLEVGTAIQPLGGQLEQQSNLMAALIAASDPVDVQLRCADVLAERFTAPPIFVSSRAAVRVRQQTDRMFQGDPRIMWLMLGSAIKRLLEAGATDPLIEVSEHADSCRALVRPCKGPDLELEPMALDFGPLLPLERECVAAIGPHLGIGLEESAQGVVICA